MSAALPLPDATEQAPGSGRILPFSCSTNLSNDVMEHLTDTPLGAAAWQFCAYMHRRTFGNAGFHRKRGREETGCEFDLAGWAAGMKRDRSNVRRVRDALVACGIIHYDPDPEQPGSGYVSWNLEFDAWQPYDGRKVRYQRQREQVAQAEQQQAGVVILPHPTQITAPACQNQGQITTPARHNPSKITTLASLEMQTATEPAATAINGYANKQREEYPANAGGTASADALSVSKPQAPVSKGECPLPVPKGWPTTQPGDDPKSIYRRALRSLKNKSASVAYMAHLSLGVPHTKDTLRHLTGTYHAMTAEPNTALRWGLIGKAIVEAVPKDILGDPLDYVHQTALGLASGGRATRAAPRGAASNGHEAGRADRRYKGGQDYWAERMAKRQGRGQP